MPSHEFVRKMRILLWVQICCVVLVVYGAALFFCVGPVQAQGVTVQPAMDGLAILKAIPQIVLVFGSFISVITMAVQSGMRIKACEREIGDIRGQMTLRVVCEEKHKSLEAAIEDVKEMLLKLLEK